MRNYIPMNPTACYSVINPGPTGTTTITSTIAAISTLPVSVTSSIKTTITSGTIIAPLIQVAFGPTDQEILSLMSSESAASSATSKAGSGSGSLSSGALAGAIIGPIVFVLLILAGVLFLCYRRRKQRQIDYEKVSAQGGSSIAHQPVQGTAMKTQTDAHEPYD